MTTMPISLKFLQVVQLIFNLSCEYVAEYNRWRSNSSVLMQIWIRFLLFVASTLARQLVRLKVTSQ